MDQNKRKMDTRENVLFDVYPIKQMKPNVGIDYRFVCFHTNAIAEDRMEALNQKHKEAYLVAIGDKLKIIGLHQRDGTVVIKDPQYLNTKGDIMHYCFNVLKTSNDFIVSTYERATAYDKTDIYFKLVSTLIKIGLKIKYKQRKGHVFNHSEFFERQINQYGHRDPSIAMLYITLRDELFPTHEKEQSFLKYYLAIGAWMEDVVPLYRIPYEN